MTLFEEERDEALRTGRCMACDSPLPKNEMGRQQVVCVLVDCRTYYHWLYDRSREDRRHRRKGFYCGYPSKEQYMAKAAKKDKIVPRNGTPLATTAGLVSNSLTALAQLVSADLSPADTLRTFKLLREVKKVVTDERSGLEQALRPSIVVMLKAAEKTTDKGGRELEMDGLRVAMHRTRTGLDPKKVEARLRAMGKEPDAVMDTVLTFKIPDPTTERFAKLVTLLGPDAVKDCQYEESWTISTPEEL